MHHPPYGFADYGRDLVWLALLLFAAWFCVLGAALRVLWRSWRYPGSSA